MQESSVDMAITTDLVEAFLKCPTKCFLRARAEVATGNAYADWVRTKSEVFRSEGITRLAGGIEPDKSAPQMATVLQRTRDYYGPEVRFGDSKARFCTISPDCQRGTVQVRQHDAVTED